jgi:hypothetical protein
MKPTASIVALIAILFAFHAVPKAIAQVDHDAQMISPLGR